MNLDDAPLVLTIPEAAQVVRIGRSAAYTLAHRYIDSGGAQGLPCIRLGRSLRVPRHQLAAFLGIPDAREAPAVTTDAPRLQPVPAPQADVLSDSRGTP
jgi:Helix-turn-helix domain